MAEQPIDKNQIIKDGTIEDVIKQFKDWETQLKKNNKALLEVAKNTEIKPVINTEDFAKLLAKVEKLETLYKKQSETTKQLTTIERERLKLTKAIEAAEAKKTIAINKENKALIQLKEEIKQINDVQKKSIKDKAKLAKLEKALADSTTEEAKAIAELNLKIQEQNKTNKELAKEKLGLIEAYERESKKLVKLKKDYKNVIIEQGASSKSAKKLRKEVKKLDQELKAVDASAGDFQRNVGNYPDSLASATAGILELASAAGVASAVFSAAQSGLKSTEEGGDAVAELGAEISGVWDVVSNTVAKAVLDVKDFAKESGANYRSGKGFIDSLKEAADGQGRLATTNTDLISQAKLQIALRIALSRKERRYAKELRKTEVEVEALNGLIDIQQSIAGDSTRSFNELAAAVSKSQELQVQRGEKLVTIARKELDLAQQRIFIQETKSGEGNVSAALLDEETKAIINLQAAQNDLLKETVENDKELRQIKQDRLERDLDILLDGYDNQKTINERIISNDKEVLEERQRLLDETIQKGNESFKGQTEILKRLTKNKVDYNELLTLDATQLNQRIRSLGASEIIEGRILEVIRDRRTEINDLKEVQEDLNEAKYESLEIERDIQAQLSRLNGGSDTDLEKERVENRKESLRNQINDLEKGSLARQTLIQEYNEILLSEQKKRIEKEEKEEEKAQKAKIEFQKKAAEETRKEISESRKKDSEDVKETYTNVLNTVSSTFTTLNSMISDSIDTAIEGQNRLIANSQRTIDLIKQSAIVGNEQAKESILAEEKAIEESQKRIEKAQKRKQRMELISTGINTFNQKVASGQGGLQALGETGAQMAGLIGLLNALPSFFIGADRLSSDGAPIDNKGGFLAINHPDERIVPASKNKIIGFDTSNEKLANIMSYYNKGLLVPAGQVGVIPVQNDNSEVLKSIENGFSKINNYNMSVEELFGQISVIVEQKKNGNIHRSKKTFR